MQILFGYSYLGIYPGKLYPGVYLLEGFYVRPTSKSAKSRAIFRKFESKWLITLLVNR